MKTLTLSLLLLVSVFLAGCASSVPRFSGPVPAPEGKALLYIFFQHGAFMRKPSQDIFVNGEKVVNIQPGSFYIYAATPGILTLSDRPSYGTDAEQAAAAKEKTTLKVAVEEGGVYFVEWVYVAGYPQGLGSFKTIKPANALYAISDCFQLKGEGGSESRVAAATPGPMPQPASAPAPVASPSSMGPPPAYSAPSAPVPTPAEVEKPHYDSLLTADCAINADSTAEKLEVAEIVAFLKAQKDTHDFDQIAKIDFVSADSVKVVFTWFEGKHLGTLSIVRESGTWRITKESHSI